MLKLFALGLLVAFVGHVGYQTYLATITTHQINVPVPELTALKGYDVVAGAKRLAEVLAVDTTVYEPGVVANPDGFLKIHKIYEKNYPKVHSTLKREIVADYSLLYEWKGSDESLAPVLVLSHIDVVPSGDASKWKHPPFGGVYDETDGHVYGRGAMDVKVGGVAILEALEAHIANGGVQAPKRSIYVALGHDEEVGGREGALVMSELLQKRGLRFDVVLDEGGFVMKDALKMLPPGYVAMVGLCEKGMVNYELSVTTAGGHSAMPPNPTPIGILSQAIAKLEANQMPANMDSMGLLTDYVLSLVPLGQRLFLANKSIFSWLLCKILERDPKTNAFIRTTTAPTMMSGSEKQNVIPTVPKVNVNFRILPGDTYQQVHDHVVSTINDPRVDVTLKGEAGVNPSPVSPAHGRQWDDLHKTIKEVFPDVLVAPYLVVGGTDSRHYFPIAERVYRFLPLRMSGDDLGRIHGIDERLSATSFGEFVRFYFRFLENSAM